MKGHEYIHVILPLKLEWEPCYRTDEPVSVGDRVRVLFANKEYIGVASDTDITPEIDTGKIRSITSVEHEMERILPEEITLWRHVAEYYMCTVGEVYKAAYPHGKTSLEEARALAKLKVRLRRERLLKSIEAKIEKLESRLTKKESLAAKAKDGTKAKTAYISDISKIREELTQAEKARENIAQNIHSATDSLAAQLKDSAIDKIVLSSAQEDAYDKIRDGFNARKPILLHGVTGSGKTEIYIKLAHEALAQRLNVLYLVPEIALSMQLEDRLYEHFGERLITFHSGESAASKRNSAEIIRNLQRGNGNYIVLGTRSSLFLPHHDIGLIIVDEEHDSSYKQDSPAPRYNGRDTALMLNKIQNNIHGNCNIVLGSATPSLEEFYNTSTGRHILVELNEKYHGSESTDTEIIDTKAEWKKNGMAGNFSRKLIEQINNTLAKGEQVLILRSRRAWSTVLQCEKCGEIQKCPHCNVSLSYHKTIGKMVCHYCGHSTAHTGNCGKCGGSLKGLGAGTQKIEEEAAALFPQARIARLDSDTAQNKSYETRTIKDFANGNIDILIGTQIITKGFDFSNLSLVAIIAADTLLGIQDFRADEKALQLLEQFRGRCGRRDRKGTFIIQTSQPEHPIYQRIIDSGTRQFNDQLMVERKDFEFPPYTRIIEISIKDLYEDRSERMAERLTDALRSHLAGNAARSQSPVNLTGPYCPVVNKIADNHIRKIRICLKKDKMLTSNKKAILKSIHSFEKENRYENHIIIDVDPS